MGFLNFEQAEAILRSPNLRPLDEIVEINHQMLAYHWRLREFELRPETMDFLAFGETCWFGPLDMSWANLDGNELALNSTALHQASPDTVSTCASIASERHLASNWLRGRSEIYSETETST